MEYARSIAPLAVLFLTVAAQPIMPTPKAIQTWHCYRADSPWSELTDSAEAEEKTRHIRSEKRNANRLNRIKPLPGIISFDDYILMRLPEDREVTVNSGYFSNLERVDVTRTLGPTPVRIGAASPAALRKFTPLKLITILLQYQVIQTYIHVESTVDLVKETKSAETWTAELHGKHTYFTNKRNEKNFAFRFILDLKSGEMRVAAGN